MDTALVRNTIQLAKDSEEESSLLLEQSQAASAKSHSSIAWAHGSGADALYDFAVKYVELVPDLFECVMAAAQKGEMRKLVQTYLKVVSANFPAHEAREGVSMIELLNEAYIMHRLIEELNDRIECGLGIPLVHFDMMQANLIIHDLIGDSFANELDKIVTSMVGREELEEALAHVQLDADWIRSLKEGRRAVSGEMVFCFAGENGTGLGVPA
jgi:hypothetical protein|tara:strand:+ start:271 stop:909 length:639 start_codon:yes stop_codon:yes gene_type:complete